MTILTKINHLYNFGLRKFFIVVHLTIQMENINLQEILHGSIYFIINYKLYNSHQSVNYNNRIIVRIKIIL